MKNFITLIKRFLPSYKKNIFLNLFFNILGAILNVFSFALIIPILKVLFKIDETTYHFIPMDYSSVGAMLNSKTLTNNFYYYMTQMIDSYGASNALLFLGVFLIVMTGIKVGSIYLSLYYLVPVRTGVVRDIREMINNKILALPLAFFSNEKKGDIISRMTSDVNEVENSVMSSLEMITKNPIMIIIYLVAMIAVSWQLTLFVLVFLPISGYIMGKVGKKLKRTSHQAQAKAGQLVSLIEETLGGLRIIKAFNAEQKMTKRFNNYCEEVKDLNTSIARRQQAAHPMSEFLGTITIVIVLWYGGTLILGNNSSIDAPQFIFYLVMFYSIINPAKDLTKSIYSIQRGMASMERIDKILDAQNTITEIAEPKTTQFNHSFSFRNVWFKYGEDWVLKDINLTVEKGKTVALVGQSGSGKSTMADLLPRFYDVDKGGIYIDDTNIKDLKVLDLRSLMGNVNQEAILFNDTIYNNIAFGVEQATQEDIERAAKIANAHNFILETEEGYQTNIGDRGGKLSGGQRQRISIARAILRNPDILILDEATSALDTESEKLVQEALENLMKNRTTLIIAHRLSTVVNADEICVLHEGQIVERGKHNELYEFNGIYKKLCDMQQL